MAAMAATATAMARGAMLKGFARYRWRVARARRHMSEFGPLVTLDHMGNAIEYSSIHLSWVWHLTYCWNRKLHCALLAPFGHGKSSGFAVPLLTWLVGQNPQYRIKVVSAGDQAAAARVEAAKQIIESPRYREVFPKIEVGRKWTNHEAFVKRKGEALDPTIHARGVETKGMGGRADFILFDDVVDDMNSMELEQRNKIKRYVHMKWMSRLHPETGRALWLATPWHVDDATHELMGMKGWCLLRQPVAQDLMSYEQEVYGAGPDYADEVRAMQAEYEAAQESGL